MARDRPRGEARRSRERARPPRPPRASGPFGGGGGGARGADGAGAIPEDLAECRRRLGERPEDAALWSRLVSLLREVGEDERALAAARRAARLSGGTVAAQIVLGETLAEGGRLGEAAEVFARARARAERQGELEGHLRARRLEDLARLGLRLRARAEAVSPLAGARGENVAGCAHLLRGELARAAARFQEADRLDPRSPQGAVNLGFLYTLVEFEAERVGRNVTLLVAASRRHPAEALLPLHLGELYEAGNLYDAALAQYAEAIARDPGCLEAYELVGRHGRLDPRGPAPFRSDLERRIAELGARAARKGEGSSAARELGVAHLALARLAPEAPEALPRARRFLSLALAVEPADAEARRHLAAVLDRQGDSARALAEFARARSRDPGHPRAQLDFAGALLRRGRIEDALPEFERAAELRPEDAAFAQGLRYAFEAARALADEKERFAATPAAERSATALHRMGLAHLAALQPEEALARLEGALALEPERTLAARIENARGRSLLRLRRFREAEAAFRRALARDPECVEAHRNLAVVLLEDRVEAGLAALDAVRAGRRTRRRPGRAPEAPPRPASGSGRAAPARKRKPKRVRAGGGRKRSPRSPRGARTAARRPPPGRGSSA